jgi:hypothetical protein
MKRASARPSRNQDGTGVPDFSTASAGGGRRTRSSKVTTPDPGRPMPEIAPTETRRRIDAGEAVQEQWRERRTDDRLRWAERPAGRSRRGRAADDHTDLCGAPAAQLMRHNRPRRSVRWACVAGGDEGNRTPNPRLAKMRDGIDQWYLPATASSPAAAPVATGTPVAVVSCHAPCHTRRRPSSLAARTTATSFCYERRPRGDQDYVPSGFPTARMSTATFLAEIRVSGWSSPSTRRRRTRVSSLSARA